MSIELYLVFVFATALLIATPGPNVALIVGTSLTHGARTGLMAVAGVNVGVMIQLAVVAAGLAWIVEMFSHNFDLIRFVGAAYLLFLGIQTLEGAQAVGPAPPPERAFARGFTVAFANPKTLIFQAAFLPQFLGKGRAVPRSSGCRHHDVRHIAAAGGCCGRSAPRRRARRAGRETGSHTTASAILIAGAGVLLAASRR